MAIIVQRRGQRAEIISESNFSRESDLQRYVYENPEVLPISDIKENAQFTVLERKPPLGLVISTGSVTNSVSQIVAGYLEGKGGTPMLGRDELGVLLRETVREVVLEELQALLFLEREAFIQGNGARKNGT